MLCGSFFLFAVAFAPQVVPYFKVGAPKGFQGVLCRESGDALHTVDEVAQFVVGGNDGVACVVLAKVACRHYFVEEELAAALVWGGEHLAWGEVECGVEHVHYCGCEALESKGFECVHCLFALLGGEALGKHEIVVEQLAQSYAFLKEVAIDVQQYVDAVEGCCGGGERALRCLYDVVELVVGCCGEVSLQLAVAEWVIEPAWAEVYLYVDFSFGFALCGEVYVVIGGGAVWGVLPHIADDVFVVAAKPYIDVAGGAQQGVGVELCNALSLEDAVWEALLLELLRDECAASVCIAVCLFYGFCGLVKLQQYLFGWQLLFGQCFYAGKGYAQEGVLLAYVEDLLPLLLAWCGRE